MTDPDGGDRTGNGDAATGTRSTSGCDADGTLASVSHVHPDTHETFWSVYRRGPAVADGGTDRARGAVADRHERTRRNGTGPDEAVRAEASRSGDEETLADVDHEPPVAEANDLWTRGFKRPSDGVDDV